MPPPGESLPDWYLLGITFLETGAFALASLLCLRNWKSAQIVSGRSVWLAIGLGLLAYTLGNVLFFLWGNVWGLDPAVSFGDFFYIISYLFLGWGMLQAVLPRRLNLEISQWLIIVGVGLGGVALAIFLTFFFSIDAAKVPGLMQPAYAQTSTPAESAPAESAPTDAPASPPVDSVPAEAPASTPGVAPEATPEAAPEAAEPETSNAPGIILALNEMLSPLEGIVGILYLIGDCILVIIATTLLVAFWGGRFSQSWKLIAVAAFCLYIADMFFAYYLAIYEEGKLWEVFWTFSAVFFALGAAVEHEISTKSRRSSRRRKV